MKSYHTLVAMASLVMLAACQKTISDFDPSTTTGGGSSNISMASIAGTYNLKALTWSYQGVTINVYDSLPACEKDDTYTFKADSTYVNTDTGAVCDPLNTTSTGYWYIKSDSLYVGPNGSAAKITSFDGTTLVLTGAPATGGPGVVGVTTFVKKP